MLRIQLVFDRKEEAKIWIPDHEILNRYRAKKNQFKKRLAGENVPQHIYAMENILDKATQKMDALEKKIEEYEAFQPEIRKLEAYYALQQPVGRVGNPMDIANMVMFLCSDKAVFITGENICIDGGMTKLMIYHDDHGWTYTPEE